MQIDPQKELSKADKKLMAQINEAPELTHKDFMQWVYRICNVTVLLKDEKVKFRRHLDSGNFPAMLSWQVGSAPPDMQVIAIYSENRYRFVVSIAGQGPLILAERSTVRRQALLRSLLYRWSELNGINLIEHIKETRRPAAKRPPPKPEGTSEPPVAPQ